MESMVFFQLRALGSGPLDAVFEGPSFGIRASREMFSGGEYQRAAVRDSREFRLETQPWMFSCKSCYKGSYEEYSRALNLKPYTAIL